MSQTSALKDFWDELESQATISLKDLNKLQELLSRVFMENSELRKSRDKWREIAENGKK